MTVRVSALGQMKRYLEGCCGEIELPDGARLADLLRYIDTCWSERFPEHIWDKTRQRFRGPVVIMIEKQAVIDPDTPLSHGQEVKLHKVLVGG